MLPLKGRLFLENPIVTKRRFTAFGNTIGASLPIAQVFLITCLFEFVSKIPRSGILQQILLLLFFFKKRSGGMEAEPPQIMYASL